MDRLLSWVSDWTMLGSYLAQKSGESDLLLSAFGPFIGDLLVNGTPPQQTWANSCDCPLRDQANIRRRLAIRYGNLHLTRVISMLERTRNQLLLCYARAGVSLYRRSLVHKNPSAGLTALLSYPL